MKTYEIFTAKYSQIIQADNLRAAIMKFIDKNPGDEIIGIHNVKYNDKLLSPSTPLKQLSDEEIDKTEEYNPYCKVCTACGEDGCCSAMCCEQSKDGLYCATYLKNLKFGYLMHKDLWNLVKDEEKIQEAFDKNYALIWDVENPVVKTERPLSPQSYHINPIELLEWVRDEMYVRYFGSEGENVNKWYKQYSPPNRTYLTTSQLIETFKNRKA